MIRETSERSRSYNKAEIAIHSIDEFIHLEFEGISTKDNKLTCLLDRGLVDKKLDEYIKTGEYIQDFRAAEPNGKLKKEIANKLGIPWLFVVYSYIESKCKVINLNDKLIYSFDSFNDFGNWFSTNYTDDARIFSKYEESGLPMFDQILRKNGTPWPGNIDDLLIDKNTNDVYCVAEYQNTSKCSVRVHDNNDYLHASIHRKGDNKRWMAQYVFANGLYTKNAVFVWSTFEDEIAIKKIDSFVLDNNGLVSKIVWGKIDYVKCSDVSYKKIKEILG